MLKIASYNLRNLFDEGARMSYGKEVSFPKVFIDGVVSELAGVIANINPDILVAQEVGSETSFNRIAEKVSSEYKTFASPPDARGIGNAAMTKVSAVMSSTTDVGGFPVFVEGSEDTIGANVVSSRQFLTIETTYNERPLYIYAVHLKAITGYPMRKTKGGERISPKNQHEESDGIIRSSVLRLIQARRLRELVDMHFKSDQNAQIIVLGDFNAQLRSDVLNTITASEHFPETQLINLCESAPTEKRFSFIYQGEKSLFDHMLISKNLSTKVVSFEIQNDNLKDQSAQPEIDYYSSDHAPIVLTLL